MSSRIKLNYEDISLLPATLLDLPTDCIASPLLDQLDLPSAAALRMVCRRLRVDLRIILPVLSLLRHTSFTVARGDAPSTPMYKWLRDECPDGWFMVLPWAMRSIERSEWDTIDLIVPPLEHEFDHDVEVDVDDLVIYSIPIISNIVDALFDPRLEHPDGLEWDYITDKLLQSASRSTDPYIADLMVHGGVLGEGCGGDMHRFMEQCEKSPLGYGAVCQRACVLMPNLVTDDLIAWVTTASTISDDVEIIKFFDDTPPFNQRDWYEDEADRSLDVKWQKQIILYAAELNSKNILAWGLARSKSPEDSFRRLMKAADSQEQTIHLAETLETYRARSL